MLKKSGVISELFDQNILNSKNKMLASVFQSYSYYHITTKTYYDQDLLRNIKESKVVIISQYLDECIHTNELYFIVSFHKTIIIINQLSIEFLQTLFSYIPNSTLYFLLDTKNIFNQHITMQNFQKESDSIFIEEINSFKEKFYIRPTSKYPSYSLWSIISCISGYLIKQAYEKINTNYDFSISTKINKNSPINFFGTDDYIELRYIGIGSSFLTVLIYHIERGELFVIKKPNGNFSEFEKLQEREVNNYQNINYFLLPKFYGIVKKKNFPVIEFINGQSLLNIKELHLEYSDKIMIIFELMMIINYFHKNGFVYRDLKPDNVIIVKKKIAFVIDFDRMIKYNEFKSDLDFTTDFASIYIAPEVCQGKINYKNDIYSLGKMINYIFDDKIEKGTFSGNNLIQQIYNECTNEFIEKRPIISELIFIFYMSFYLSIKATFLQEDPDITYFHGLVIFSDKYIDKDINKAIYYYTLSAKRNHPKAQYYLGYIYESDKYITHDINKAIYYYSLAAKQNDMQSQFNLGYIYENSEYITHDINKAIYYYSLAAKQNNSLAQLYLGNIYDEGIYVKRDISKAIYYYTLAAELDNGKAQLNLGTIYINGEYVTRDIRKGIHYFLLAAKHNDPLAYHNLGLIYESNKYNTQDIKKAIYYYSLGSDFNDPISQLNLGSIYGRGEYVVRDINKAIYYFTLSANQNNPIAQYNLAIIYESNEFCQHDKAIFYYKLAANQNNDKAQFSLGSIYEEGIYVKKDINKAIYYYSQAAENNHPIAQYNLGFIYEEGEYVKQDINKAIYYYTRSANKNYSEALYALGIIYCEGKLIQKNIKKGIYYLLLSSKYGCIKAHFVIGYLYHQGKYISMNIKESIIYYKKASSMNDQYAKNNLGIIYKIGYGDEIPKNIGLAISYFEEAIRLKKDEISMYNLAHLFIYDDNTKNRIDISIELLLKASFEFYFDPAKKLLLIALFYQYGFNLDIINEKLVKKFNCSDEVLFWIIQTIKYNRKKGDLFLKKEYDHYKNVIFLYDDSKKNIPLKLNIKRICNEPNNQKSKDISKLFYEGFGIDI